MADKGFDVEDLFAQFHMSYQLFKRKKWMTGIAVVGRLSSKRVHIERILGFGTTFKILTQPLNHTESILS